ncbi:MAG: hypothetical protein BRC31_00225, partial [Actinobacteria bacterium QS_5_72_10]
MRAADLQPLVDASDDAALLRGIDQLCELTAWGELVDLAGRCDDAVELGRQLWAVRQHIEYRLALEAPPAWAGPVVRPGAARFALGPLTEVVAERFAWAEIAAHLDDPVAAATLALAGCAGRAPADRFRARVEEHVEIRALSETTDAWSPGRLGGLTAGQRIRCWRAGADAPTAAGAIAGLAHARPVRAAACTPGEAMAWLQWAGAAGG